MCDASLRRLEARREKITPGRAATNTILSLISEREYELIAPHLTRVSLDARVLLQEPSLPIAFGYFPDNGVVSLIVSLTDGRSVEVGIVGREGFVGAALAGGLNRSPHRAMVQVAGDARRITAEALDSVLPFTPGLRKLLTRYAIVQGMQLAQTAACNRLHGLEQRMARWLMMTQDRVSCPVLAMTHEHLAALLGTDRPSVTVVARRLQREGIVEYKRGLVKILSRHGLREKSCECYEIIQHYYSELGLS